MYDKGENTGNSCYRLLSRTGQFIYLKTHGYLEIDSTGTVESFICVNCLVSEKEGELLIQKMKEKYSALVKNTNLNVSLKIQLYTKLKVRRLEVKAKTTIQNLLLSSTTSPSFQVLLIIN